MLIFSFSFSFSLMDTTNVSFYTPLKKLPDRPVNPAIEPTLPIPSAPVEPQHEELIPLNEISIKLNKTKLFNKQNDLFSGSAPKKAIYYKPPSSSNIDNQYGVKSFIPPPIKRNFPILRQAQEDNHEELEIPTGEWVNPVIQQALQRQENPETQIKNILSGLVAILAVQLTGRSISLLLFDVRFYASNILLILIAWIAYSFFRLRRCKDQCLDLPLSNKQRALLDLDPIEEEITKAPVKPKYSRI